MVGIYLTTAIGVPVYMHYCEGELEKVSYLIKSKGCCENDEDGGMACCCQDESAVVRCAPDFTFKKSVDSNFKIADFNLFTVTIPFFDIRIEPVSVIASKYFFLPPDLQQSNLIRTTFLRI
jgi:hypothetical protein